MKKSKSPKDEQKQKSSKQRREIRGLPYTGDIIELRIRLNLSVYEAYFLICLRDAMNPKNRTCWKSEKTLATEMGCSRATVIIMRYNLEKRGLIQVGKRENWHGRFALNEYQIIYPWEPVLNPQLYVRDRHTDAAPRLPDSHGALTATQSPPRPPASHKSVKGNSSKSQSVKQKRTDSTDTSFLTDLTGKKSSKKEERSFSLPPISSDRGGSRARNDSEPTTPYDPWDPEQGARRLEKASEEERRMLEDFHSGEFNFSKFGKPFQNRDDLDTLLPAYQEKRIEEFWDFMYSKFWNLKHKMRGGIKRWFFRACREGAGEKFGLKL